MLRVLKKKSAFAKLGTLFICEDQKRKSNYSPVCLLFLSLSFQAASPRWEPQIAVLCEAGQSYHPQHLSEEGRWTTALNIKTAGTTCLRDKMDLLDHCKKVSTHFIIILNLRTHEIFTQTKLLVDKYGRTSGQGWQPEMRKSGCRRFLENANHRYWGLGAD